MKLKAVAFDVIETLFEIQPLEKKLIAVGLPSGSLKVWFARLLRDAFALEVIGESTTFREVASATLKVLADEQKIDIDKLKIEEIIGTFGELPAHPDVKPAFEKLRDAGVRIAALTNCSKETTKKLFQNANLGAFVDRYISIDEVKHWKPAREVYLHAAKALDVDPSDAILIAAHDWDIRGARCAGFMTGFIQRKSFFSPAMGEPQFWASSLPELIDKMLAAWRG